jgi:hypothetical protein
MIRLAHTSLLLLLLGSTCVLGAEEAPPADVLARVQSTLDAFAIRNDGRHHTPRPDEERTKKQRATIEGSIAALDARQMQASQTVRLQALILSTEHLQAISQLKGIRLLSLQKCTITFEGFAHLAENWADSLEQLTLSYVDIAGGGSIAESTGKLRKLKQLTLNKCSGIGLDVVRSMSEFPIEAIDMNRPSSGVNPEELFEVLGAEYKSLRKLDLHHWQKHDELRAAFRARRPEVAKGKVRDLVLDETP